MKPQAHYLHVEKANAEDNLYWDCSSKKANTEKEPHENYMKTSNEVAPEVNTRTVRFVLFNAGRIARRPLKKQLLTKKMMLKRMQWAGQRIMNTGTLSNGKMRVVVPIVHVRYFVWLCINQSQPKIFMQVLFSNEAVTSKHIKQVVKYPVKVMFWGCFLSGFPGRLHIWKDREFWSVLPHFWFKSRLKNFNNSFQTAMAYSSKI